MCEECGQTPCNSQCPNAPPVSRAWCPVCRKLREADEIDAGSGICEFCRDRKRSFASYIKFASRDVPQFLDFWYYDDRLNASGWGDELQKKVCGMLFGSIYLDYQQATRPDKEYALQNLYDYTREYLEEWTEFLKEENNV